MASKSARFLDSMRTSASMANPTKRLKLSTAARRTCSAPGVPRALTKSPSKMAIADSSRGVMRTSRTPSSSPRRMASIR